MSQKEISEAEIQIIRWGEKILTPLLVAGFIGIMSFLVHVSNTMAQLSSEQEEINGYRSSIDATLKQMDGKIDDQAVHQHKTDVTLQRIDSGQQYSKEQIDELKEQNAEIIKLLRNVH